MAAAPSLLPPPLRLQTRRRRPAAAAAAMRRRAAAASAPVAPGPPRATPGPAARVPASDTPAGAAKASSADHERRSPRGDHEELEPGDRGEAEIEEDKEQVRRRRRRRRRNGKLDQRDAPRRPQSGVDGDGANAMLEDSQTPGRRRRRSAPRRRRRAQGKRAESRRRTPLPLLALPRFLLPGVVGAAAAAEEEGEAAPRTPRACASTPERQPRRPGQTPGASRRGRERRRGPRRRRRARGRGGQGEGDRRGRRRRKTAVKGASSPPPTAARPCSPGWRAASTPAPTRETTAERRRCSGTRGKQRMQIGSPCPLELPAAATAPPPFPPPPRFS